MGGYIGKRLAGFAVVLVSVSVLSFLLIALSGTDPAEAIARRGSQRVTEEQIAALRHEMGLDRPPAERYVRWIAGLFAGDAGTSIYSNRAVSTDLGEYLPVTFALVGLSLLWVALFAIPTSLLCARYPDGVFDHAIRVVTLLGICTPSFWLGFLLLIAFAVRLPVFGVLPAPGLRGYVLPSLTLSVPIACAAIRLLRGTLRAEANRDYAAYLRACGHGKGRILCRHMLPNALPPVVTLFCQYLGYLVAGSAVAESVFSLKGMGTYLLGCVLAGDAAAVSACVLIVAAVFVAANLLGDILNRMICPWMVRETND